MKGNTDMDKKKNYSRQMKGGMYSVIICLIVLAVAFVANMLVSSLPNDVIEYDTTNRGLFTLSEQTEEIVKSVDETITIYQVCQTGNEDNLVTKMLKRYDDLSDSIRVEMLDPQMNPALIEKYTAESLADNSIIVESEKRYTVIPNSDIYTYMYDDYYDQSIEAFGGEGAVTSAIGFVTKDDENLPVVYLLTGHNEPELSDAVKSAVERDNMILKELNLAADGAIPKDAACIIIHSPATDFSADEAEAVLGYLNNGGRMVFTVDYRDDVAMPNVDKIVESYGVEFIDGIVVESDSGMMMPDYNHYLIPELEEHAITNPLRKAKSSVLMPICEGIREREMVRGTVTAEPLLTTSDGSFSKQDGTNMKTFEKEEGDTDGPFSVAMAVQEVFAGEETRIVFFGTSGFLVDEVDQYVSGGNKDIFLNALGWAAEQESGITIRAKEINVDYLTMSAASANTISIIMMVVLPVIILAAGIVVAIWIRRRS